MLVFFVGTFHACVIKNAFCLFDTRQILNCSIYRIFPTYMRFSFKMSETLFYTVWLEGANSELFFPVKIDILSKKVRFSLSHCRNNQLASFLQ